MSKEGREYRTMPLMLPTAEKRIESDFYVEGFATTFNQPYVLWTMSDGTEIKEKVDRHAFDHADMSDVLFQYNHGGRVFARNKMKKGKPATMILEIQERGLFVAADLGSTGEARKMYEDIDSGLVYQMSFGFRVEEDSYDRATHTRTILKVSKVFDVSAVDVPANGNTNISSRDWFNGVIEAERQELSEKQKMKIKITRRIMEVKNV